MNQLVIMSNEEKKKIIEKFEKEQEKMAQFYKKILENIKPIPKEKQSKDKPKK